MKNLEFLSLEDFFLGLASLREAKPGVRSKIRLSLVITNLQLILREFLGPLDLFGNQALGIRELAKIVVVNKNKDLVFSAFHILVPSLKGLHNGRKLLMVGLIPNFSQDHLPN